MFFYFLLFLLFSLFVVSSYCHHFLSSFSLSFSRLSFILFTFLFTFIFTLLIFFSFCSTSSSPSPLHVLQQIVINTYTFCLGQYQPSKGMWECSKCPAGYYCLSTNDSKQIPCPERHYCPTGSSFPTLCPDGSYAKAGDVKFVNSSQCRNCITGSYCRAGRIFGPCAAGYFCKSRSPDPNPLSNYSYPVEAGPCPAGFYCPNGTLEPEPCPQNTLKDYVGGNGLISDCKPCPAGKHCFEGMFCLRFRRYMPASE